MDTKKIKQIPAFQAAASAFACGTVVHAFGLVNVLHNYDNILQLPKGYGAGITSGRWLLGLLGDFFQNVLDLGYNLPLVKGLVYLALIALSAALVVDYLGITGGRAVLTGCLMATFPTVFDTMAFRYTAPYYGLALLLSVLAAWVAGRKGWGIPVSALCLALSMGIYQAYPPVTISLFLLWLMREALAEDAALAQLIRKGLRCCVTLVLGVALYFVILKIMLALYSLQLDSYQGINAMGQIPLSLLPTLIKNAWYVGATFTLTDYCGLVATPAFKVIWTLMVAAILALSVFLLLQKKRKPLPAAFFCLMGLLFPLGINFIAVMCPYASPYAIMVYAFVMAAIAPLMLLECLPKDGGKPKIWISRIVCVLAACILFYDSYYGNLNYTAEYYANRQVENYFSGMFAQIRMTEEYTPDKTLAFLGEQFEDPKMWNMWGEAEPKYAGFASAQNMLNANYSVDFWVIHYLGYESDSATAEEKNALWQDPRVEEMPCWPSAGSIRVVDDYLVVKLEEMPEPVS